jgi:transcriptional regulator with XRE-family HTH domain
MQFAKAAPEAKELRRRAGAWLKEMRGRAGLSQMELAERLGLKYYTFVSQVENGFGRVPTESMEAWARALGLDPADFARQLLSFYDPELHRLLFEAKK